MKTMFIAAAAAFLVLGGAAQAKPVGSETHATQAPAVVVMAKQKQIQLVTNPLAKDNPTGLPAYEMRPDGLMINGLLPANGWQG
jgi:hypothetical protein